MQHFAAHALQFSYPDGWVAADETADDQIAVTVQSDGTVFWTLAVLDETYDPVDVLQSAMAAFAEDYPEADFEPATRQESPLGEVWQQEVDFVCHELIAAARVTVRQLAGRLLLTVAQGADDELDQRRSEIDAMNAGIRFENEPPPELPGFSVG